jgi:hypothetical protein
VLVVWLHTSPPGSACGSLISIRALSQMQEYGRLRHRYIVQGEVSVNEWHDHFLAHGAQRTSLMSNKPLPPPPSSQKASIQSIVQHWTGFALRRNQVLCTAQCLATKRMRLAA